MPTAHLGRKDEPEVKLVESNDLVVVRTRSGRPITRSAGPVPTPVSAELDDGAVVAEYPEVGVTVYRVPAGRGERTLESRKAALRASPDVRFAGGVLVDPTSREPVLYTENLFVKFLDDADPEDCEAALRDAGLIIKEEVKYATNSYFVEAPEGTGQEVFAIADRLLRRPDVEYCHPELIRPRARKSIFPAQWHLKKTTLGGLVIDAHANVEAAHEVTEGEGVVIAIIDDGVDIDHPEFSGAGKIVAPRDATLQTSDPRPRDEFGVGPDNGDNHGTACAGVACAAGILGASGVAPKARLMPIRLASGLGSQREADAFVWAADHGADVISCSWGPTDGRWWLPNDPKHQQRFMLPASTRLAIDYATTQGRGGKGCVVLFAAGNGRESVDHDGYASYSRVIAVAACNDRGSQSVYSDFGQAVWCAFPSSDFGHAPFQHPAPMTTGIWTTDRRSGAGYNPGQASDGDAAGNFTNSFGGTSSACPGAAGVAALVLAVNPELKQPEVKALLQRACDRIDPSGGNYNAAGHSPKYGYGRLNARTAVALARPGPGNAIMVRRRFDALLPDLQTVRFTLEVTESAPAQSLAVDIDLAHTFIGDLVLTLEPPAGIGVAPVVLHQRTGGAGKSIRKTYDAATTPALARFTGKACRGAWTLVVRDAAARDSGTLATFGLALTFPHAERLPTGAPAGAAAIVTQPAARNGKKHAVRRRGLRPPTTARVA